jgi:hypothetical protein
VAVSLTLSSIKQPSLVFAPKQVARKVSVVTSQKSWQPLPKCLSNHFYRQAARVHSALTWPHVQKLTELATPVLLWLEALQQATGQAR